MTPTGTMLPPITLPDSALQPPSAAGIPLLERPLVGGLSPDTVERFLSDLFGEDLHAKRVLSMANGVTGVLQAGSLCIHAIGRGLAAARCGYDRHGIKQVDRFLSNYAISVPRLAPAWIAFLLGQRTEAFINLDWTEFDDDDHSMLVASLQTDHGRSTPLLWKTVRKSDLGGQRNDHEDELMRQLRAAIPRTVRVTLVADRGFADQKFFHFLKNDLGFDYLIRFRSNILVTDAKGVCRPAREWARPDGRFVRLKDAKVTGDEFGVGQVVVVQETGMKDVWCLALSDRAMVGEEVKRRYGKRFSCEEFFRDVKDIHFGMGLSWTQIGNAGRRDRLFLLAVLAYALLTMLGAAGEALGLDRLLKTSTKKGRQLSLFRQGIRWYTLLPGMRAAHAEPLLQCFSAMVWGQPFFRHVFGAL